MTVDADLEQDRRMCTQYSVLIAEDDAVMRNVIKVSLERSGFRVKAVGDGMSALRCFGENHYDLVILDIRMPEMDGYEVCRQLRKRTTVPIIIVTTESDIADVVSGYELGADIYVTKPFRPNELVLRVEALLRRVEVGKQQHDEDRLLAGSIEVNRTTHQVLVDDAEIELTPNEYSMLCYFMEHPNLPISKDELLREVWGYMEEEDANLLRVTVRRLRAKIEPVPSSPTYLQTVRGVGYVFVTT